MDLSWANMERMAEKAKADFKEAADKAQKKMTAAADELPLAPELAADPVTGAVASSRLAGRDPPDMQPWIVS